MADAINEDSASDQEKIIRDIFDCLDQIDGTLDVCMTVSSGATGRALAAAKARLQHVYSRVDELRL